MKLIAAQHHGKIRQKLPTDPRQHQQRQQQRRRRQRSPSVSKGASIRSYFAPRVLRDREESFHENKRRKTSHENQDKQNKHTTGLKHEAGKLWLPSVVTDKTSQKQEAASETEFGTDTHPTSEQEFEKHGENDEPQEHTEESNQENETCQDDMVGDSLLLPHLSPLRLSSLTCSSTITAPESPSSGSSVAPSPRSQTVVSSLPQVTHGRNDTLVTTEEEISPHKTQHIEHQKEEYLSREHRSRIPPRTFVSHASLVKDEEEREPSPLFPPRDYGHNRWWSIDNNNSHEFLTPPLSMKHVQNNNKNHNKSKTNLSKKSNKTTTNVTENSKPTTKHNKVQMYLDLGQANFAKQCICPTCGMMYVHGVEEDARVHQSMCKSYHLGVPLFGSGRNSSKNNKVSQKRWRKERVVARFLCSSNEESRFGEQFLGVGRSQEDRILEIRSTDPVWHKRKVQEVKHIVDQEMGFVNGNATHCAKDSVFSSPMAVQSEMVSPARHEPCNNEEPVPFSSFGGTSSSFRTTYLYISSSPPSDGQHDEDGGIDRVVGLCSVELVGQAYSLVVPSGQEQSWDHSAKDMQSLMIWEREEENQDVSKRKKPSCTSTALSPSTVTDVFPSVTKLKTTSTGFQRTKCKSQSLSKTFLGIHQIWCHAKHRRKGIATKLLHAARQNAIFGTVIDAKSQLAFSSPTMDGFRLAISYVGGDRNVGGGKDGSMSFIKVY